MVPGKNRLPCLHNDQAGFHVDWIHGLTWILSWRYRRDGIDDFMNWKSWPWIVVWIRHRQLTWLAIANRSWWTKSDGLQWTDWLTWTTTNQRNIIFTDLIKSQWQSSFLWTGSRLSTPSCFRISEHHCRLWVSLQLLILIIILAYGKMEIVFTRSDKTKCGWMDR